MDEQDSSKVLVAGSSPARGAFWYCGDCPDGDNVGMETAKQLYDRLMRDVVAQSLYSKVPREPRKEQKVNPPNIGDGPLEAGKLERILVQAIRDAREIAKREGVKADRAERVGIFKTCLRRYIGWEASGPWRRYLIERLASAKIWFDIGLLANPLEQHHLYIPFSRHRSGTAADYEPRLYPDTVYALTPHTLRMTVEAAMEQSQDLEADIQANMRMLRDSQAQCEQQLAKAKLINEKAERVAENLLKTLEE